MPVAKQQVVVRLTVRQAVRMERLGECLWPQERLSVEEIGRRLLLEYLLWAESERGMVEPVRSFSPGRIEHVKEGHLRLGRKMCEP